MNMNILAVIGALVLIAVLLGAASKKAEAKKAAWLPDVPIPMPDTLRAGIEYVYYLAWADHVDATADHTSLIWWAPNEFDIYELIKALEKHPHLNVVMDVASRLMPYLKGRHARFHDPQADLAAWFQVLRDHGVLHRVRYLVPLDEPNAFAASEAELLKAVRHLKAEAARWHELAGVRHICIYADVGTGWWCLDEFDIAGVDHYEQRSQVLVGDGASARLQQALAPHQQLALVPGAGYGQDPDPFVAFAHATPQVWGVVPFIWLAKPNDEGWTGLAGRPVDEQERYRQAGLLTLNRQ